jgi:hypothetical protein
MIPGPLRAAKPARTLSLMQQRFQADPERCLSALEQRADRLFEDGYVVIAGAAPLVFIVGRGNRGSDPRDSSVQYFVHAIHRTCSCPFYTQQHLEPLTDDGTTISCKHLRGLEKLIRHSVTHYKETGDQYPFFRLLSQWMAVMAEEQRSPSACKSQTCGASNNAPSVVFPAEAQKGLSE